MLLNYFYLYLNRHQASEAYMRRRRAPKLVKENDEALLLFVL